jgi:hypothetical protein
LGLTGFPGSRKSRTCQVAVYRNFVLLRTKRGGVGRRIKMKEKRQSEVTAHKPRTPLGQRLWGIRARIVASDEPLLGWEEIEQEVTERRGEAEWAEKRPMV